MNDQNIIFFDGQCNLCDRFVNFIFKKDIKKQFLYAPLQGMTAKKYLKEDDIENLDSIIFFYKGASLKEAQAIKALMKQLYPRLSIIFSFLPLSFFNFFYRLIAKRRYFFFGKKNRLYQASKNQKEHFLP